MTKMNFNAPLKYISSLRELNEHVHSTLLGHKLLTQEEMKTEATEVWRKQPSCVYFIRGFSYNSRTNEFVSTVPDYTNPSNRHKLEKLANDANFRIEYLQGYWLDSWMARLVSSPHDGEITFEGYNEKLEIALIEAISTALGSPIYTPLSEKLV